ncbi:MAG: phosphoribosylformylglycinamidine synthase subunit PurL [Candidatus Diapherotrites archaeon CG11_big_fil_rev_8_21_14_0_20_37_9]|nr:MAG: phosphoribosylformylglycinamidine synthase subunit PurL [Candidatus Diapherotrites archaeon CG11_big_fil_rev_8_21_14_0_20_37_9]
MTEIKIINLSETELMKMSKAMLLSLDIKEMKLIQAEYKKIGREPKQIELETLAQTWSEHCKHKTFTAEINYMENEKIHKIKGLFKSYIKRATDETHKDWLVSVFSDNAGIIKFNDKYNIAMKAETHNHPSALDPYGGANTGVGGVVRDILGVGLGAKPIANTDVFCFANPDYPKEKLPEGILHPKRIFKGVRAGVRDYGNRIGVPTINGAILFDDRYLGNPLVYCGTIGLIPKGMEKKEAKPGDMIVVIGGKTGRDGIHGATFSSTGLDESASSSAVQIGNPIEEKKMIDAILKARELGLYTAITDCGAGGFSSAVGEMGEEIGAKIHLEKAPLKYKGLEPWEIWVSEAQERMVLAVPGKNFEKLKEICEIEGTEATIIGEFTNTKKLELFFENELVGELEMDFLHKGVPLKTFDAQWTSNKESETSFAETKEHGKMLLQLLGMPNIASKETTVRSYDHEVMGGTVAKPFVGLNDGPADASIIMPVLGDWKGVVVSNGINPFYSDVDPYWMACSVIDEAIRNAICVGANFSQIALLDNFSWGNPEKKEVLGELVRACKGCYDAAIGFETPYISGKDSLYNEYSVAGKTIEIPGTLLISAMGVIPDSRKKISMPFKKEGNLIYIIGITKDELGGSHYAKLLNAKVGFVPKVDFAKAKESYSKLSALLMKQDASDKTVVSLHDCSEGGLAVCVAEMVLASGKGSEIFLKKVPFEGTIRNDKILFSESNSRIIVEVSAKKKKEFEEAMKGCVFSEIGHVSAGKNLAINGVEGKILIQEDSETLKRTWKKTLGW